MLPELDQRLDEFVDEHLDNFIKWDLVVFFHQHPDTIDSPRNISTRLGRRREEVSADMVALVGSRILAEDKDKDGNLVYVFRPQADQAQMVDTFITALDSREQRLQILTKLLRLGARS